jgi:hypothetical protein
MITPVNRALNRLRKGVVFGIAFTTFITMMGIVRPRAQSQTADQQKQQQKEREEEQRQAESRHKEGNAEQNRQPAQRQAEQEPQAATEHNPGDPAATSDSAPKSSSPTAASSPTRVYTPRASSASSPAGANGGSGTTHEPSSSGITIYKPHSLSASSQAGSNSGSGTTYEPSSGITIYKPHSPAGADPTPNSAGSTTVNGPTVYAPGSTPTNKSYSSTPASPSSNCVQIDGVSDKSLSWACSNTSGQRQGIPASPTSTSQNPFGSLGLMQAFLNRMSATMAATSNPGGSSGLGAPGGPCYWSSEWDGLNSELQGRLSQPQTVDTVIAQYGGPAQIIAYAQTPGNLEREFASLQGQGLGSSADFQLMAAGFVDVARCRLGQAATQQSVNATQNDKRIADCDSALQYVADPNGLQRDLDVAIAQRRVHEDGLTLQQNLKAELLSNSWWATSKGPVVAAQIEAVCNEVQDFVAMWNPEEAKLNQGKDLLMKSLGLSAKMIKAAYDNRESVTAAVKAAKDAEAEQLGDVAAEEAADAISMGPAYGTYKALEDSKKYVETLNEAADARAVVQDQLLKLDQQISQAQAQVSIDAQKQMVLEALRQDVIAACVQKPINIPKPWDSIRGK